MSVDVPAALSPAIHELVLDSWEDERGRLSEVWRIHAENPQRSRCTDHAHSTLRVSFGALPVEDAPGQPWVWIEWLRQSGWVPVMDYENRHPDDPMADPIGDALVNAWALFR